MNSFTIKDLENISGIKAHTIRIWEQRYSFLKPLRTTTNIRHYSNEELKKVLNIALLNKYGFKISHIDKMSDTEMKQKIVSLNQAQAQQERVINEMIQHMVDLNIDAIEVLLDESIRSKGIERTISQVIFSFMEKIGILWLTNHINPAQEHLVTNLIRQKLIVGIDNVSTVLKVNKSVLLFLPEGEHHEIGLLFMYYMLKNRGVNTIYLGANVPLKDVEYVNQLRKPDYIYTHLTSVAHHFNFEKFIQNLTKKFDSTPIVISGLLTHSYEKKIPPQINFKRNIHEAMAFVAALQ